MLNYVIGLAVIASLLVSCGPEVDADPFTENCPDEGTCTHEVFPFSSLSWHVISGKVTGLERTSGSSTVYHYTYTFNDNPLISDDEYMEELWLEVPGEIDNFSYESTDIDSLNFFIRRQCFCPGTDWVEVDDGSISGTVLENGSCGLNLEIGFDNLGIREVRTIIGEFKK